MAKEIKIKELPPKIKEIVDKDKKEKEKNDSRSILEKEVSGNSFNFPSATQDEISPVIRNNQAIIREQPLAVNQRQTSTQERQRETLSPQYTVQSLSSQDSQNKYNPSIESNLPERIVTRQSQPMARSILPESSALSSNQSRLREEHQLDNSSSLREYESRNLQDKRRRTDFF